jgi:outer membrane lipoprotein carrier protein
MRISCLIQTGRFNTPCATSLTVGVAFLFVLSLVQPSQAEDSGNVPAEQVESSCGDGVGEKAALLIQSRYDDVRDIHANFEQINESATFAGQPLMAAEPKNGRVTFAKPGKMRWTYLSPEPSVVVSNGELLWIYDVGGKSITRMIVTEGFLTGAALQFLLGDGQILESFEVYATECRNDRITLELIPKADATYERLGLVADPTTGMLIATSVLDLFGNLTEISFSETRTNLDPEADTFEMDTPDGVELIDYADYSNADDSPEPADSSAR